MGNAEKDNNKYYEELETEETIIENIEKDEGKEFTEEERKKVKGLIRDYKKSRIGITIISIFFVLIVSYLIMSMFRGTEDPIKKQVADNVKYEEYEERYNPELSACIDLASDLKHSQGKIDDYIANKAEELLKENGFTKCSRNDDTLYHYDYDVESFKKLGKLKDVQIYSIYRIVDNETITKILKANGYKDMDDYLLKKGYLSKDEDADIEDGRIAFATACLKVLDKEMGPVKESVTK